MDVTASSQISAMAASAGENVVSTMMLKKALDHQASAATQLLQGLPQKDGTGKLVDVQA